MQRKGFSLLSRDMIRSIGKQLNVGDNKGLQATSKPVKISLQNQENLTFSRRKAADALSEAIKEYKNDSTPEQLTDIKNRLHQLCKIAPYRFQDKFILDDPLFDELFLTAQKTRDKDIIDIFFECGVNPNPFLMARMVYADLDLSKLFQTGITWSEFSENIKKMCDALCEGFHRKNCPPLLKGELFKLNFYHHDFSLYITKLKENFLKALNEHNAEFGLHTIHHVLQNFHAVSNEDDFELAVELSKAQPNCWKEMNEQGNTFLLQALNDWHATIQKGVCDLPEPHEFQPYEAKNEVEYKSPNELYEHDVRQRQAAIDLSEHTYANFLIKLIDFFKPERRFINLPDQDGVTPLMLAAKLGQIALVEKLLKRGANISHVSNFGETALDFANKAQNSVKSKIVKLISETLEMERGIKSSVRSHSIFNQVADEKSFVPSHDAVQKGIEKLQFHFCTDVEMPANRFYSDCALELLVREIKDTDFMPYLYELKTKAKTQLNSARFNELNALIVEINLSLVASPHPKLGWNN